MKTRDVIVGFLVVVAFVTAFILVKNKNNKAKVAVVPTPSVEQKITSQFGGIKIPDNADKADLLDVAGGKGLGEAARTKDNGKFDVTVLADLDSPKDGYFYEAWLQKDGSFLSLGKLRIAKGGYLTDFISAKDYSDYKTILVTLEKVFDSTPETTVLKGSF